MSLAAPVRRRPVPTLAPVWAPVGTAVMVAAVVVLLGFSRAGIGGYASHPVSVLATAAAAVVVRRLGRGHLGLGVVAAALGATLVLAAVALVVVVDVAGAAAPRGLVGAWAVLWVVVLTAGQAASVLSGGRRRAWSLPAVVLGCAVLVVAVVAGPPDPFAGVQVATGAPAPALLSALTDAWCVSLLVLPARLAVDLRAALSQDRATVLARLVGAATAPLAVLTCLALAVARDPGMAGATTGSVAWTVVLAVAATAAAAAATERTSTSRLRLLVGGWLVGLVAVLATVAGVVLGAAASPALAAAGTTAAAVAGACGALALARAATRWARPAPDAAPVATAPVPSTRADPLAVAAVAALTPREREVLALLAEGSSNAEIAAALVLSVRTVESHVRNLMLRLDLADEGNRRVRAAGIWAASRS